MNWTELLIALVSHGSWPVTILALAWMFRAPLRSFLGRIESAKSKYLNVSLRSDELVEKLWRAQGIADALELPKTPVSRRRAKTESEEGIKHATNLVAKEPAAGMFAAWDLLVDLAGAAIEKKSAKRPASDQIIPEAAKFFNQGVVSLMASMMMIVEQQKSNPSAHWIRKSFFASLN